ncbi:hypothetical protein IWW36_004430 [Coemansia brasiliensis]|uniref:Uncharacterized protein n=1 Tax=Coemansia brasiliensis TaxID=2650707 RepID=A0A9W8I9R7_9FUNG|nr:hypothetical protein IWW36_004430 [Coemansia brasiliensis]
MDISLLSILQSVDSDRLAEFLKNEHHELLALRNQVCIYEGVISELKLYLHNVFAIAGGLDALPLSGTTRAVLGLAKDPNSSVASQEGLSTPRSLHLAKNRSVSQPAEASAAYAAAQQFLLHYPPLPQTPIPATSSGSQCHLDANEAEPSKAPNILMTPASAAEQNSFQHPAKPEDKTQLATLIGELKQTVNEQQTDIEDLEAALRERKALIRALRKQMRDNELRQFAAASDHAGLRRTASIIGTTMSASCQQNATGKAETPKMAQTTETAIQDSKGSQQDSDGSSLSSIGEIRRPSGYINGWPVYETEITEQAPLKVVNANVDASTSQKPEELDNGQPLRVPFFATKEPLRYKASTGSGLNRSIGESTHSSRTPRIFHSVVVKTPRRIYSRLSNRLKKD